MSERAILYTRTSYSDAGGDSHASQLEMCRDYATQHGYHIIDQISESHAGASGADLDLPGLNRVLEAARAGRFDVLIVREMDRLARDLAKQLYIESELSAHGARIEYVIEQYDTSPEGQLGHHVRAVIAQYERLKTRQRTIRGKRDAVQRGNVMLAGNIPFGYDEVEIDGRRTLAINAGEADIVRDIFRWYVYGDDSLPLSLGAIARKLTDMRVLTKNDKGQNKNVTKRRKPGHWGYYSVGRIIGSRTYIGEWVYNTSSGPDIIVEVPAIVSREIFEAAERKRARAIEDSPRNLKHNYLLRRRIRCLVCGYAMSVAARKSYTRDGPKLYQYYRCGAEDRVGDCNAEKSYTHSRPIDAIVWRELKRHLADPELLRDALQRHTQESHIDEHRQRIARIDTEIEERRAKLQRVLDLYLDKDISRDQLANMLAEKQTQIEQQINALQSRRNELAEEIEKTRSISRHIESLTTFAATVRDGLDAADESFEKRRWIVEVLDIEVHTDLVEKIRIDMGGSVLCYAKLPGA